MAIYPTEEQIQELLASPKQGPVVMLNLLTFKAKADAPDEGISGVEAYERYGAEMRKFVESRGGRFLYIGTVDSFVIGEFGKEFHAIALVEYPSRKDFVAIAMDPHVAEIGKHRAAGLESQWLVAGTQGSLG